MELAFLAPAFLGVIMLIIQFALWFNARQIALASAQAGARVAREQYWTDQQTWSGQATSAATTFYRGLNSHLLGSLAATSVQTTQGGTPVVGVRVTGPLAYSVFSWFGLTWTITETVTGPAECFHPVADDGGCG